MAALLLLFLLFGTHHPKCPPLQEETESVYIPIEQYVREHKNKPIEWKSGSTILLFATTTLDGSQVLVGTTTDQEAVEYNKRVRDCRTNNGEF